MTTKRRKNKMRIGIALKVDVTKINKERLFKGKQGIYADLVTFIDTEEVSKYGDNGTISQSKNKGENVKMPILGNARIFWSDKPSKEEEKAYKFSDPEEYIPF
jgi:hypothetical protein